MDTEKLLTLAQAHEKFAKSLNGKTWDLLGKEDRTREEDELMVLTASASLYHWLQIGTAVHAQRGEWLLAQVYTVLEKTRTGHGTCPALPGDYRGESGRDEGFRPGLCRRRISQSVRPSGGFRKSKTAPYVGRGERRKDRRP